MIRVIKQTHDEKIVMYMKMKKLEIAKMLVNANEAIDLLQEQRRPPKITSITIKTDPSILMQNG